MSVVMVCACHSLAQILIIIRYIFTCSIPLALDGTDAFDVANYLIDLDHTHIYHLGIVLGLGSQKVKALQQTPVSFLDDVVSAWIRQENAVAEHGLPTWRTLVRALRHKRLGQEGIAANISHDKGV